MLPLGHQELLLLGRIQRERLPLGRHPCRLCKTSATQALRSHPLGDGCGRDLAAGRGLLLTYILMESGHLLRVQLGLAAGRRSGRHSWSCSAGRWRVSSRRQAKVNDYSHQAGQGPIDLSSEYCNGGVVRRGVPEAR